MWRIELFGGLRLINANQVQTRFRTQKTAALLGFLAYRRGRPCSREKLADLLWPDDEPCRSRASLCMALSSLRSLLEPPGIERGAVVTSDGQAVMLSCATVSTDVAEFDRRIFEAQQCPDRRRRLSLFSLAVDQYRPELLSGYYESWILVEQSRLERLFLSSALHLIQDFRIEGETDEALRVAHRSLEMAPFSEELHRQVIRIHLELGNPASAARQFERMERMLLQEFGIAPSARDRELWGQIRRSGSSIVGANAGLAHG